ncbi:hypothetical protein [Massilia forsythiae]|uniref:hypothetical protein n=1 Tax=Massilia forsythiae TaxID=2728020 RepID=UPI001E591110|nr:hypothetical protein [Massilia forsythiae]
MKSTGVNNGAGEDEGVDVAAGGCGGTGTAIGPSGGGIVTGGRGWAGGCGAGCCGGVEQAATSAISAIGGKNTGTLRRIEDMRKP